MMKTIEEAKREAVENTILANKAKLETEGLSLTAEQYNSLGQTYKLYALCIAVGLTHNNLKSTLNDMELTL